MPACGLSVPESRDRTANQYALVAQLDIYSVLVSGASLEGVNARLRAERPGEPGQNRKSIYALVAQLDRASAS